MNKILVIFLAAVFLSGCGAGRASSPDVSKNLKIPPIANGIETGFPDEPPILAASDATLNDPPDTSCDILSGKCHEEPKEEISDMPGNDDPNNLGYVIGESAKLQEYPKTEKLDVSIEEKYREALVVKIVNSTDEPIDRGGAFHLEKKIDGKWYRFESPYDMMFPASNVWMEPGSTDYDIVSLKYFYQDMPNGEYRYVKAFSPESDFTSPIWIAVEFSLDESDLSNQPGIPGKMLSNADTAKGLELSLMRPTRPVGETGNSVVLKLKNNSDQDAEYGEYFRLLRKIGNNWYYVDEIVDNRPMPAILLTTPAGSESLIDWIDLTAYGDLPEGCYGIEIPININGEEKTVFCGDAISF